MNGFDIIAGWPSTTSVNVALKVADAQKATLKEGMIMHIDAGEWKMGCPAGYVPFVSNPAQSPDALDVERNVYQPDAAPTYGAVEVGGGEMGGVGLQSGIAIETPHFDPAVNVGQAVWCDPADGILKLATAGTHQIIGSVREKKNTEYGVAIAVIDCMPSLLQSP